MKKKLIVVDWIDSHSNDGWESLEHKEKMCVPYPVRSVGWLIAKNDKHVTICSHIGFGASRAGNGHMTIPEAAITKMSTIKGYSL